MKLAISKGSRLAEIFREFFDSAVKSLNMNCNDSYLCDTSGIEDPVDIAMKKF